MILLNLAGAPGSGKSTTSSILFAELKMAGVKAELVGEEAKEIVFDKLQPLFENQVLITGRQWQRILRLQQSGCEVAISDSPLIQGTMYAEHLPYYQELYALVRNLEAMVPSTYNVFVQRVKPYEQFGRDQDEAGSDALVPKVRELIGEFWLEVPGNREGANILLNHVLALLRSERLCWATERLIADDRVQEEAPHHALAVARHAVAEYRKK